MVTGPVVGVLMVSFTAYAAVEWDRSAQEKILEKLQRKASQVLIQTEFLSVDLKITTRVEGFVLRAESKMTPGKLYSRLFIQDPRQEFYKQEKLVAEILLRDGTVWENRVFGGSDDDFHNLVMSYPSPPPYRDGTDNMYNSEGIGGYLCPLASSFSTWLGENTGKLKDKIPLFLDPEVSMLEVIQERRKVGDKLCWVVIRRIPAGDREDRHYWDPDTGLCVLWETYYTDTGKPELEYSRHFSYSTSPIPVETWEKMFKPTLVGEKR